MQTRVIKGVTSNGYALEFGLTVAKTRGIIVCPWDGTTELFLLAYE